MLAYGRGTDVQQSRSWKHTSFARFWPSAGCEQAMSKIAAQVLHGLGFFVYAIWYCRGVQASPTNAVWQEQQSDVLHRSN